MKYGRFWRIQVLGGAISQYSATKSNHTTTAVANRKHQAVTESVVSFTAVIADQHACGQEFILCILTVSVAA